MSVKTISKLMPTAIDEELLRAYSYDCSFIQKIPKAVAWFKNAEALRKTLVLANREGFSITPRGFGTNISGSAITDEIVLSFERFSGVEAINEKELWVDVRAGTRVSELNNILEDKGLYLPFNFVDNPSIGGLIARNLPCDYTTKGFAVDNILEAQVFDGTGKFYNFKKRSQIEKLSTEGCAFVIIKARLRVVETPITESQTISSYSTPELAIRKAKALLRNPKTISVFVMNPIASNIMGVGEHYTVISIVLNEGEEALLDEASLDKGSLFDVASFVDKGLKAGIKGQHHVIVKHIEEFLVRATHNGLATVTYIPSGFSIILFNEDREKVFNIARGCYNAAATGFGIAFKQLTPDNVKRRFRIIKEEFDYNNVLNKGKVMDYK